MAIGLKSAVDESSMQEVVTDKTNAEASYHKASSMDPYVAAILSVGKICFTFY